MHKFISILTHVVVIKLTINKISFTSKGNMSRILFQQLFFFGYLFVISESCPKTQCLVTRSEIEMSTRFQSLFNEEGVRIVYFVLNLSATVIESYNSSDPVRILPNRWTWAQSNEEPLLSLPYDYDVLSLSLLQNQARNFSLEFSFTQLQCLKALNASCKDLEITRLLLNITNTTARKTGMKTGPGVVLF